MRMLLAVLLSLPGRALAAEFRGESCQRCHTGIRDAAPRPRLAALPEEKVRDVIVIGGGVAGLTTAYRLKDLDVLLLEKEDAAGGKVRRELWGRARYPVAAGYMAQLYLDPIKKLFAELGLSGEEIPEPGNSFFVGGERRVVADPWGTGLQSLPQPGEVKKEFAKLRQDLGGMANGELIGQAPPVAPQDLLTPKQRELDKVAFYDYMKAHYGEAAASFSERYSMSLFGADSHKVSAWAGLVYLAGDFGGAKSITWEGGPGIISEKLAAALGPRLQLGALATAVIPDESGVAVEYELHGKRLRARAKSVVVAVPSFVAKRLILGLPDWKKTALSSVRYSAYAVAIVALDKPFYKGSFDLWSDTTTLFTDLEPMDWGRETAKGPGTPAQILEAFAPMGEDEGRRNLLNASDERIGARVADGLEHLFPGIKKSLHGVRVIRWGHAMPLDYPGYLSAKRDAVERSVGRLVFAGVDSQMPCIEGAIMSGLRAADEARRLSSR